MSSDRELSILDDVDPFLGNGASDAPPTEGLAATWFWPKAQTGNTHPGACYPYGMVSACAYSGAYVTGYGLNMPSYDGQPDRMFDDYTATGFAHFQQSGTGAIGSYYNYLRVTPLVGSIDLLGSRWPLRDETASPGYYAATLDGAGIRAELTVSRRAAVHRYTFGGADPVTIALDVSAGGLALERMKSIPTSADFEVLSDRRAQGWVVMEGIRIHFYVEVGVPATAWGTWTDSTPAPGERAWRSGEIAPDAFLPFGLYFEFAGERTAQLELKIAFSVSSARAARANVAELDGQTFDDVACRTRATWEAYLSRIRVEGGTADERRIFRSLHYFSLIKPADFGEPYWEGDGPFFFDLATMWDMYKTQLPLMLTLYPERGRDLINAIIRDAEHFGEFPNGFVMNTDVHRFDDQASCLAHVTLSDAYVRGLGGIDWQAALQLMATTLKRGQAVAFAREGKVHPYTHTLDLAYASFLTARMARELGDQAIHAELSPLACNWRNAYDPETSLLSDESRYYEGTLWNYSFRLFHDVAGRILLHGNEDAFVETLDRFFGFDAPPCTQVVHRPYGELMQQGFALGRFEGLNNEPDVEAPYVYIYAGRHDRTAHIVRTVMAEQYHTGRGGLPGNDDSGGLASWYVWSAVGLFPVAGQGIYLIGSPIFGAVSLALGDHTFRIEADGSTATSIHIRSATLNGQPLHRAYLHHAELAAGGTLRLQMSEAPSNWARQERPPSYPS